MPPPTDPVVQPASPAEAFAREAVALQPDSDHAMKLLGETLIAQHKNEEAVGLRNAFGAC